MRNENYLFNNDEEFKLLIGDSQSYKTMQDVISKLVGFVKPNYMIEFGSGSGATSIRLAKENPRTSVVAVDVREKLIEQSLKQNKYRNVTFVHGDLTKLNNFNLKNCNLILLMYSFKYIEDPNTNKFNFLKELYEKMQKGAYIIIGDTFIDTKASKENVKNQFENIYYNSSKDAYWNCLSGLSDEQVKYALNLQNATREKTKKQVEYAVARDGIYPVSRDWMFDNVKKIGFKIVIGERTNNLNDTVFVLQK